MPKTIIFIHGAWMTPLCWEYFNRFFSDRGYQCEAPAWPYHERTIDQLRSSPDPRLANLGVTEIVDHFANIIKGKSEPPILIGHSFGGLFTQLLLDRGLGSAGVAIDSAPPRGVSVFKPTLLKANMPVLLTWMGWRRVLRMSFKTFQYAFVNTLPLPEQRAVYDKYAVPETGRIFFQSVVAPLNPRSAIRVNFHTANRAPLLLIAGGSDHIVPVSVNRSNYNKYKDNPARTDFKQFPGRAHWIIAQPGWEEVAGYVADWLEGLKLGA